MKNYVDMRDIYAQKARSFHQCEQTLGFIYSNPNESEQDAVPTKHRDGACVSPHQCILLAVLQASKTVSDSKGLTFAKKFCIRRVDIFGSIEVAGVETH